MVICCEEEELVDGLLVTWQYENHEASMREEDLHCEARQDQFELSNSDAT